MSPDPDFHSSGEAWLDATATPGEGRILQEILHTSPAAAREFAALARTNAALEMAHLSLEERTRRADGLITQGKTARFKQALHQSPFKWAAAALLILLPTVWLCLPQPAANTAIVIAKNSQTPKNAAPPSSTVAPVPVENLPPADAAYGKFMDAFIIPDFRAEGLTLHEAVALLTEKVRSLESATFQVEVEDLPAGNLPEREAARVHVNLKYQPASTLLKIIALQTSMKVHPTGQSYVLRPGPAYDPLDVAYRTVSISRWELFLESQELTTTPPSTHPATPASPGLADVSKALLATLGEAPIKVEPWTEPGKIKIGSGLKLNEVLGLVLAGSHAPGTLSFELTWPMFKTDKDAERLVSILQKGKNMSKMEGVFFFETDDTSELSIFLANYPSPRIAISPGKHGDFRCGDWSSLLKPEGADWIGWFCHITSQPVGSKVICEINAKSTMDAKGGKTPVNTITGRQVFSPGMTAVVPGVVKDRSVQILFLTARIPDSFPFGIPVPDKPGFVLSPYAPDKGQVDVQGIQSGAKVQCPYTNQTFRVP